MVAVDLEDPQKNWLERGLGPELADFDVDLAASGSKALGAGSVKIFSVSQGRPGGPFGRGGCGAVADPILHDSFSWRAIETVRSIRSWLWRGVEI